MKTVAVYTNEKKDKDLCVTNRVLSFLDKKCNVVLPGDFLTFDDMCATADALIVLGGDGTLLRAARKASKYDVPVLGINLGRVGYLAEIEPDRTEESLDKFLKGDCRVEERFMINAKIVRNGESVCTYDALNDIVVSGSSFKRLVSMDLYVDGDFITSYDADGVVASTPTGSTAYSLSAGGPITDSSMELIMITPICAHTLSSRPLIIPPDKKVEIVVKKNHERTSLLTVDGQEGAPLEVSDRVTITKSKIKTKLIRVNGMSFYEILRKKLSN